MFIRVPRVWMAMCGRPSTDNDNNRPELDGYTIILDRPLSSIDWVYWDYDDVYDKSLLNNNNTYGYWVNPLDGNVNSPDMTGTLQGKGPTIGWLSPWSPPTSSNPSQLLELLGLRITGPSDSKNPNAYRWQPLADTPRVSRQFWLNNAYDGVSGQYEPPQITVYFDLGPNWINP